MTRLGRLTTIDLEAGAATLLVPVGSCEQHGPHLPLEVDTRVAVAVCEGVAGRAGRAVVAPPITIGASGEHAGFIGTLSIGTEVLRDVLVEVVRSAGDFEGVLLVNAHGGNAPALAAATAICESEGRPMAVHHVAFPDGDAHAGRSETSIMLALAPDLVRIERAVPGATAPIHELMPRLRTHGVAGVSPTGVLGDPTGATAAEGRRLLEQAILAASKALASLV